MARSPSLNNFCIVCLMLALACAPAYSLNEQAGTSGAAFLKIDGSVRAAGLGGSFAALADGPSAIYFNPAGIRFSDYPQLSFTSTNWLLTSNFSNISYIQPAGAFDSFGFGLTYVSYGSIQETTATARTGTGRFFTPVSMLGAASWARDVKWALLGANIKLLSQNIDSYNESGIGVDVGLLSQTPIEYLRAGISILNIGTSAERPLPLTLLLGFAYESNFGMNLLTDLRFPRDGDSTAHLGIEYSPIQLLTLRGGLNTRNVEGAGGGYSLGVGLNIFSKLKLDYAYVPYAELGETHRIGLILRL